MGSFFHNDFTICVHHPTGSYSHRRFDHGFSRVPNCQKGNGRGRTHPVHLSRVDEKQKWDTRSLPTLIDKSTDLERVGKISRHIFTRRFSLTLLGFMDWFLT